MTATSLFDIPVFWPILLVYFLVLFGLTLKKQITHMLKYRYLPFDLGKKRWAGKGGKGGGKKGDGEAPRPAEPRFTGSSLR